MFIMLAQDRFLEITMTGSSRQPHVTRFIFKAMQNFTQVKASQSTSVSGRFVPG